MFSKKLAILMALAVLAAVPAFGAADGKDVESKDHVKSSETRDRDTKRVETRENDNNPNERKEEAAKIATERDSRSGGALSNDAANLIKAKLNAAKSGNTDAEVKSVSLDLSTVGANSAKDDAATKELETQNKANFETYKANVAGARSEIAKIRDSATLARVRKMVRAFRDKLIALRLNHTNASVDTLRDAISTYARSVAGDNWAAIEEGAARLQVKNPSLSEKDAKLQAAKEFIKQKHPNMRDDIVDQIAKEIVLEKSCV